MLNKLIKNRLGKRVRLHHLVIILLTSIATALACGWTLWTDHSVRFNGFRSGRGFYRLPPLPFMYDPKTGKDLTVDQISEHEYNYDGDDVADPSDKNAVNPPDTDDTWARVKNAVDKGDLVRTKTLATLYLAQTAERWLDDDDQRRGDREVRRRSAMDMLDVLGELNRGASSASVTSYLKARLALDDTANRDIDDMIHHHPGDTHLEDNWAYLNAALLLSRSADDTSAALDAFRQIANKYPRSEKNEAVLYMIAKLTMQSSHSFGNESCGVYSASSIRYSKDPPKIEPIEQCRDEKWSEAIAVFKRLMKKYPNGRYRNDARGWLAYLYRRGGMRAEALAEYYQLLGNQTDREWRLEAKRSLQVISEKYDDETLDKVETLISREPDAAMAYAYHRIYNEATDLTYEAYPNYQYYSGDGSDGDEKKAVSDDHVAGNHELKRIAKFSSEMIARYPDAAVSGGFILRVAEAQFELKNFTDAEKLATKAMKLGVNGNSRAQALWIKGAAEHSQKEFTSAEKTIRQLVREFPNSELVEGAQRLLAMTAEDKGDLDTALDHYLELKYDDDVAYFVDVLMSTDQLAKYLSTRSNVPQYNKLLYALAVRYMRDSRWDEAKETYRRVITEPGKTANSVEDDQQIGFAKETYWDENPNNIKTAWVMQDLKTIDRMADLQKAVVNAQGDEAKAEAMYQLASFQFDANTLLFYNPSIWPHGRYELLSDLGSSERMRLPNESQILFEHFQTHDTVARCIPLYLEIVDKYPNTKAAGDALYTAAVAHERLSDYNPYWREIYGQRLYAGQRMVTYGDVKRAYPKYQLPRGTYGWEASTRTVNGGPGWAPKPTPLPKISRDEKAKRKLKQYFSEYAPVIEDKVRSAGETAYGGLCRYLYLLFSLLLLPVAWKVWKSSR